MGNLFAAPPPNNPDLIQYVVYPRQFCSLGRFEPALTDIMDPRLYYFMSHEQFIFELQQFDKRLNDADSDGCVKCCAGNLLQETENALQVLCMQSSMRNPPLQFSIVARYKHNRKRHWRGWQLRVLLPPGTTERFQVDLKAGRVPTRLVMVAAAGQANGLAGANGGMRASVGQPAYATVKAPPGGGAMPPVSSGYSPAGASGATYVPVPSAPQGGDQIGSQPPPYSRFDAAAPSEEPPIVQKSQMV